MDPHPVPLSVLIAVAGRHWSIEEAFQAGNGLTVLDEHQVRRWPSWRKLPGRDQALLVLGHLRNGDTYKQLAASFKIGVATTYRYVHEAVTLLARRARSLIAARWMLTWTYNNFTLELQPPIKEHGKPEVGTVACTD